MCGHWTTGVVIDLLCPYWTAVWLLNWQKQKKSSVRDSLTRSARASHALRACEAREKKPTVRFPYNEFVVTRRLKNVVGLSKIYSQIRPLCKFDTPGDWFRERIARVTFVCIWLRIFWKIKNEWKWQYADKSLFLLLEEAENRAESFR